MKETYVIEGMSCAACSSSVERVTRRIEGVIVSEVNLITGKLTIEYDNNKVTPEMIMNSVTKAGFGIRHDDREEILSEEKKLNNQSDNKKSDRVKSGAEPLIAAIILCIILLYISMGPMLISGIWIPDIISIDVHPVNYALTQLLLTIPVLFIGRKFFINGYRTLARLHPNMDSLVALGCTASFLYSVVMTYLLTDNPHHVHHLYYESAAVVITLIMLGKYLENRSKQSTKGAITKLLSLTPDIAVLIKDGKQTEVKTSLLHEGDCVLVKPGCQIPLDGTVYDGHSSIDESMLTGESIPVTKQNGDNVTGGSVNQNGLLYVKITHTGNDTTLAKIIKFVEEAQSKKAPISQTADKVAGVFVPIVMLIAVIAAAIWLLSGKDINFALRIFTSVLVIACPCALGLATPTAIMVGTGAGAENGILIRSGEALETTHRINTIVLDKTGTVTEGRPAVTDVVVVPCLTLTDVLSISHSGAVQKGTIADEKTYTEKEIPDSSNEVEKWLIYYAKAAESLSDHPLAAAVMNYQSESGEGQTLPKVSYFKNISGQGIKVRLDTGENVLAGNKLLMSNSSINTTDLDDITEMLSEQGKSLIYVAVNNMLIGLLGVADKVKETSKDAVADMKKLGLEVILLTGDNSKSAAYIGGQIGVDQILAEVLPRQKAEIVLRLQNEGKSVMMVGDGINDSPALAQADVGCAIGNGSDIAIESADIVLMRDNLEDVVRAVHLSRLTIRNIRQNLFWAFCYNTIGIPIAAGALYLINGTLLSPMLAGLAMSLSSICVVTNALRLKYKKL